VCCEVRECDASSVVLLAQDHSGYLKCFSSIQVVKTAVSSVNNGLKSLIGTTL
jgi:hypothetical protein